MSKKYILHILLPDKFTIPIIHFLNEEFKDYEQYFLCIERPQDKSVEQLSNLISLSSPQRKNLWTNAWMIYKHFRNASKIIMHGNTVLYFFFLFPFALEKTFWVIYGGSDLGDKNSNNEKTFSNYIKKKVLKRISGHITHIEGDSHLANNIFGSKARFFYSPMYLSNTINVQDFPNNKEKSGTCKILVGNSTSPTNRHQEIFKMLLAYKDQNIKIYSPLSYGKFQDYKNEIIQLGEKMFGDKFIPVTNFMTIEEYRNFLNEMDIAIFNHKRQEAMGVTTSLLAMGKTVYMYPNTTSFNSLIARGIKVFDIQLVRNELFSQRNISGNRKLIDQYYSPEVLKNSWQNIYEHELSDTKKVSFI